MSFLKTHWCTAALILSLLVTAFFVHTHWRYHYFYAKLRFAYHICGKCRLYYGHYLSPADRVLGQLEDDFLDPAEPPHFKLALAEVIMHHDSSRALLVGRRGICSGNQEIVVASRSILESLQYEPTTDESVCITAFRKAPLLRAYQRVYGSTAP